MFHEGYTYNIRERRLKGMEKLRIKVHEETLGITERSLTALRNELARRVDHSVQIFQMPSADGEHCHCYGILIIDLTTAEAVIVGDGFRGDSGGEGGAGHRAAESLLCLFGFNQILELETLTDFREGADYSKQIEEATRFRDEVRVPADQKAGYIDWVVR